MKKERFRARLGPTGVFERAEGGTIFFDELGEMSVNLQPKFSER